MKKLVFTLLLLSLSSCGVRSASLWLQQDRLLERLEKEREKLDRQNDPIDRTKTQIKISDILVDLISRAVRDGDLELMESRLDQYLEAVQDAGEIMLKSGRDAHRRPAGFKDLEIALRRQLRRLEDIGGALTFDQREPINKVRGEAAEIREQLLRALFGAQNVSS